MNNKILLSVLIPTYNRLQHIKRQVSYFQSELQNIPEGTVEVIISNNASNDGTYEFLESLKDEKIKINHNDENIGAMGNMNRLLYMAQGKYYWLPGDDDYLKKGLVVKIILLLQKYELSYIYLSRRGIREKDKFVTEEGKTHCVEYDKPVRINNIQITKLLIENYSDLKFQTSSILKREIALKCENEYAHLPEDVRGSNFTIFRTIRSMQSGLSYFISDIEVLSGDEILWKDLQIDYGIIADSLFIDFLNNCNLTRTQCRKIKNRQVAACYSGLLQDKEMAKELKKRGYPEWRLSLIPVMLRLALRKVLRKFGFSKYYTKRKVNNADFGITSGGE